MERPNFRFIFQSKPSTRTVRVGDLSIAREPLIIDFSSTYPNNQESAITIDPYTVVNEAVDITDVIGRFLITNKTTSDGTFLFYEYQPMYDAASSGFLVRNEDGEVIKHVVEYGYIEPTNGDPHQSFLLSSHTEIDYDVLNGHSEIGVPSGSFSFAPTPTPSGELGYETHADSLAAGRFAFREFGDDSSLPEQSGAIDFTFFSVAGSENRESIISDDWAISIGSGQVSMTAQGDTSSNVTIDDDTWYRGRVIYRSGEIRMQIFTSSLVGQATLAKTVAGAGLDIDCQDLFVNHLAIYKTPPPVDWNVPTICPRYHHALRWKSYPVDSVAPYRIRILTETNDPASITYDAWLPDGSIQQNRKEPMNHVPIYKESFTETQDWAVSNNDLLLNGPIATSSTIYIKPLFEGFVSVDVVNNNVVVTNGSFQSVPYDSVNGKYKYELLEYEEMLPFETDNQNIVFPQALKESKYKATVLSAYTIKVLPMVVFDGRYPNYVPPVTEDIYKTVNDAGDAVTTSVGELDVKTWRKSRGVKVYVNGNELQQNSIKGFDVDSGIISLNVPVVPEDNVEVTFLRKVNYFICNYPRLKPEISSGNSWRIYLRSSWPNYFLENPTDRLERLAYRELVNGEPVGDLKSCVTNDTVIEPAGTIKLADISLVPVLEVKDSRVVGGGLLPDSEFDSKSDRINQYRHSIFFSNIATPGANNVGDLTTHLPWPSIFVRIPNSVKTAIEAKFSTPELALEYIKQSIEKHLALGTFYIIIDENNQVWDKPFPTTGIKQDDVSIELP